MPMPSPKGVCIRICNADVPALLRRACEIKAGSMVRSEVGGGVASAALATDGISRVFNTAHPALKEHVHRYGDLGSSFVFTGAGVRFCVKKVGLQHVAGTPEQASRWKGEFEGALKPPAPYVRPLYGKQAMPPLPAAEVQRKQQDFAWSIPGPYLQDHLHGPDVARYLQLTGARVTVSDPGQGLPLCANSGKFFSLRAIYNFLSCAFTCRPKPLRVRQGEAALSHHTPRRWGLAGLAGYLSSLSMVSTCGVPTARVVLGRCCETDLLLVPPVPPMPPVPRPCAGAVLTAKVLPGLAQNAAVGVGPNEACKPYVPDFEGTGTQGAGQSGTASRCVT